MTTDRPADARSVLAQATELGESVDVLTTEVRGLRADNARNSVKIRNVKIAVVLLVVLIAGGAWVGHTAYDAAKQAKAATSAAAEAAATAARNHQIAVASCETGNDFRTHDLHRWQVIIDEAAASAASSPVPQTEAQKQALENFIADVKVTDTLRDCSKVT